MNMRAIIGDGIIVANVWAVDPARGDLYVVHVAPGIDHLVQVENGIVDTPSAVMNREMLVKCDSLGNIIALPYENRDAWCPCRAFGTYS